MQLGSKATSHETLNVQKYAVRSEDYADFAVNQPVMTVDGFPGVVTAVLDGPFPGTEAYRVTLDNDMGGGEYRIGDLSPVANTTAAGLHQASDDYPELGDILQRRPDIAQTDTHGNLHS